MGRKRKPFDPMKDPRALTVIERLHQFGPRYRRDDERFISALLLAEGYIEWDEEEDRIWLTDRGTAVAEEFAAKLKKAIEDANT